MTATYTVKTAEQVRTKSTDHGEMQVVKLTLDDGKDTVNAEWFTKITTPLPAPGSQIAGELSDSPYGRKFKKAAAGGFGGGGPRPEDPKRAAAIQRMHDQDMALRAVELALTAGVAKVTTSAELFDLIGKTADWFGKDVKRARDAA